DNVFPLPGHREAMPCGAVVERLWRTVKYEEVYLRAYAARASIGRYFDFYNGTRPHSSLGGQTPDRAYLNQPSPPPAA
ncbi:integrase core domain-containing protein, partial [uncultured Jannaschia sp.]|uniref:integrase core domain-containing protein n=1 Tax=uncultured Jannaschia sp. TaxID=293347 RepID=UPI00263A108E